MREILVNVAHEMGELFREGFYGTKGIKYKGTVDLVTEYDEQIDAYLCRRLSELFPDFIVVGEESWQGGELPPKAIFVDPIDGTTNYVHGIPHCAISIGVWEKGLPLAGVVYNPILKETFSAQKGKGAFCNEKSLHISPQTTLQQALVATGFPYTKAQRGDDWRFVVETLAKVLPATRDVRRLGAASLDLCYVAKGVMDLFYEINLKPWDTAAGIAIVSEAGGIIHSLDEKPFTIESKGIVAGNPTLVEAFKQQLLDTIPPKTTE